MHFLVCCRPQAKIISSAPVYIIISSFPCFTLSDFNLIRKAFTASRVWIWPNEGKKKTKKGNEKLNRLAESLEFVRLSSIWGSRDGIAIPFLSAYAFSPPTKRLQPWPDFGPYLRLSLGVLWAVVKSLFAVRGEVSREADILREGKSFNFYTQRAGLPARRMQLCTLCDLEYNFMWLGEKIHLVQGVVWDICRGAGVEMCRFGSFISFACWRRTFFFNSFILLRLSLDVFCFLVSSLT